MRPTEENTLSREYIARDPRTGLPIAVAKRRKSAKKIKVETGPWVALSDEEVFSLLNNKISTAAVRWKDQTINLDRTYALRALGRFHGVRVHQAHSLLLAGLESDEASERVASLEVLPEVAVLKSDELFDWLSVLLDDQDVNVRKAASRCLTLTSPIFPSGVSTK